MKRQVALFISLIALTSLSTVGCGKKPSSAPESQTQAPAPQATGGEAAPAAAPAPTGATGSIKGTVKFTGATPPVMPELNRQADPFCAKTKMNAQFVVVNSNNTLQNVAIRVVGATGGKKEGAKITLDQENCMYVPHMQTAWYDEEVDIANSDPTLHNVHAYSGTKDLFNRAQPQGAPTLKKTFTKADGEIIKFKCDVHPWMTGWLILSENGLNAVTGDTGEFTINDVPVGTYTLKAFQETYGEKEVQVTVEEGKEAVIDFSYDGSEKAAFKYKEIHLSMNHEGHDHTH